MTKTKGCFASHKTEQRKSKGAFVDMWVTIGNTGRLLNE
jgi:hypothetical protein